MAGAPGGEPKPVSKSLCVFACAWSGGRAHAVPAPPRCCRQRGVLWYVCALKRTAAEHSFLDPLSPTTTNTPPTPPTPNAKSGDKATRTIAKPVQN